MSSTYKHLKMKSFFPLFLVCSLILGFWPNTTTAWASPQGPAEDYRPLIDDHFSHVDYLPRYREKNKNFIISKVEYGAKEVVLHCIYISTHNDMLEFVGHDLPYAWALETPKRPGSQQEALRKLATVKNIRLNNELQLAELGAEQRFPMMPQKGDVLSCELHVENLPYFVKVVNLTGGPQDANFRTYFEVSDLMLKSATSPTLGSQQEMKTKLDNFYTAFSYAKSKVYESEELIPKAENLGERPNMPIQSAMQPVDYMPNMLNTVEDLECQKRVILKNVYFHDNKARFSRRVHAMKTLGIVQNYLERYPSAKVVLHGHTDIFGDAYNNLILSKERVLAVKRALIQKGVDRKRIITLHHGGSQPLPHHENGGAVNRRVEAEIICGEQDGPN